VAQNLLPGIIMTIGPHHRPARRPETLQLAGPCFVAVSGETLFDGLSAASSIRFGRLVLLGPLPIQQCTPAVNKRFYANLQLRLGSHFARRANCNT
jgi:acyl CoA:acetate/3-ketoacid CoA transferase beta subunit